MNKNRIEAFTDAVIAIIMTILVLGLKIPKGYDLMYLWDLREPFLAYLLSFLLLAVTWHNHHHMFQIAKKINGKVLWMNTIMLFGMSLIPFATEWVGSNLNRLVPEIFFGVVFLIFNVGYCLVAYSLIRANGKNSDIYKAISGDKKVPISLAINIVSILAGFILPQLVFIGCWVIPLIWFIPNRRVEKNFH